MTVGTTYGTVDGTVETLTVGAQKLNRAPGTQAEKGAAIGASRALIKFWEAGQRTPSQAWREKLLTAYGIAPGDWDCEPAPRLAVVPKEAPKRAAAQSSSPPAPDPTDIIGGCKAQLERIAQMRAELDDPRLLVRLEETESQCRHKLATYLGEGRVVTEASLLRSPAFARVVSRITAALDAHPEALLAVAEALESVGD